MRNRHFQKNVLLFAIIFVLCLLGSCRKAIPVLDIQPVLTQPPIVQTQEDEETTVFASQAFIESGITVWRYVDDKAREYIPNDGTQWTDIQFEDKEWKSAIGGFGAKNGDIKGISGDLIPENLLVQYEEGTTRSIPSYFFRTALEVDNPGAIELLNGSFTYDDAAIVYLNGEQVFSVNIPTEGYADPFSYGSDDSLGAPQTASFQISGDLLNKGTNVIAVELHQDSKSSSDVYFDFIKLESINTTISQVYVGVGSDEKSACISWRGEGDKRENANIQFWRTYSYNEEKQSAAVSSVVLNPIGYSYRAELLGLLPATSYTYQITCGDMAYRGTFQTGETSDGTDILMLGDPQLASSDMNRYGMKLEQYMIANSGGMDLVICLGDVSKDAQDVLAYNVAFESMAKSHLQIATVMGNHDVGDESVGRGYFSDSVCMPNMSSLNIADTQRYGDMGGDYWFMYGEALFLGINSNLDSEELHKEFFEKAVRECKTNYGDPYWYVVIMHHSPYSNGYHSDYEKMISLRERLAPIFTEYGVDVVFSGHDHTYSRSYMMDEQNVVKYFGDTAEKMPGQIIYFTLNSSSGSKYYDLSQTVYEYTAYLNQEYRANLTKIKIKNNEMHITTFEPDTNAIVDDFTIVKAYG